MSNYDTTNVTIREFVLVILDAFESIGSIRLVDAGLAIVCAFGCYFVVFFVGIVLRELVRGCEESDIVD